jgi:CSLREA domain-containing protein
MGGGRQQAGRGFVTALIVLVCALVVAPAARADFIVNSTADEVDDSLGDESCHTTPGNVCTLRAAIEEGDNLGELTSIGFDKGEEGVFDGQPSSTITLKSRLPDITVPVLINGTCETGSGAIGPCVGISGLNDKPALVVSKAKSGKIAGLAITGAQTAVRLLESPETMVQGNWFGVALGGASPGNGTGVLVESGSDGSFIGGEGELDGNVFAGNAADGLDVHGGNGVKVYGNLFGVAPDGVTPSPNGGDDIEVVSAEGEVTGTEIGTRVSAAAAASPRCDGGCNVISGAAANGVDLQGEAGESPATSTLVLGNYVGISADGSAAVPNADAGVNVGTAPHTLVGGPSVREANRIDGGSVGVLAGLEAGDLAIRGNLIGAEVTGAGTLNPPDDGIVVDSGELVNPALEAEIADNEIRMEGGSAILQKGRGAWIHGNEISGAQTGIKTVGPIGFYGNVVEDNRIEGSTASGILVENDFNEIVGNQVLGSGGPGIWIQGNVSEAIRNSVGGETGSDENLIEGSAGAAIEISNEEKTDNEIARNHGAGNGGLFIDLVAKSPATEVEPNRGIKPPAFSTSTQTGASGGAVKGTTVRVFRKQTPAAGELESFLGEAVADKNGSWAVSYGGEVPAGTIVAATQTKDGATSELAVAPGGSEGPTEGGAGGVLGSGGAQGIFGSAAAPIRPRTKIVGGKSRHRTARFVFAADQAGSTFLCRLDDMPFDICKSPKRYVGLGIGKHVFWVRAVGPAGHVDLSPAKKKFSISG